MPVGIPVTVVMPVVAPIMKIENCRRFGANVIIHGANIGESRERALLIGKDKDYMYINGFDHPNILVITGVSKGFFRPRFSLIIVNNCLRIIQRWPKRIKRFC